MNIKYYLIIFSFYLFKENINLDLFYTLESKLNSLLLKLNNYEICYNETQDWLSYFFGNYFYEKEMEMFDSEQNKKQMIYYINFE